MKSFTLTIDDAYNYLLTNTAGFQALDEDKRQEEAKTFLEALEKKHNEI